MKDQAMKPRGVLESGRRFRRPGGALPALVAATLRTPLLTRLPPREQELATIVYLNTSITATEVEAALSSEITNAAVRSMLTRLVAKGVLRRTKREGKFFYAPALLLPDVQDRALERVIDEFFGGSFVDASRRFVNLMRATDPEALAILSQLSRAPSPRSPMAEAAVR
jgi:predicted transcriptional regulator